MATQNGISVTYNGGNVGTGTQQVDVYATEYYGRNNRTATFSASGTGTYSEIESSNKLTVTQLGKEGFIDFTSGLSVAAEGGQVDVSGTSNLAVIKMKAAQENDLTQYFASAYVNGVSVTKQQLLDGYTVTGDPGATGSFPISISFTIPSSSSATGITWQCLFVETISHDEVLSVMQQSTGTSYQVWFGNGGSAAYTAIQLSITLDADGEITGTNTDPRVLVSDSSVAWTISSLQ